LEFRRVLFGSSRHLLVREGETRHSLRIHSGARQHLHPVPLLLGEDEKLGGGVELKTARRKSCGLLGKVGAVQRADDSIESAAVVAGLKARLEPVTTAWFQGAKVVEIRACRDDDCSLRRVSQADG